MQMSDEVLKHEYDYDRIQLHSKITTAGNTLPYYTLPTQLLCWSTCVCTPR